MPMRQCLFAAGYPSERFPRFVTASRGSKKFQQWRTTVHWRTEIVNWRQLQGGDNTLLTCLTETNISKYYSLASEPTTSSLLSKFNDSLTYWIMLINAGNRLSHSMAKLACVKTTISGVQTDLIASETVSSIPTSFIRILQISNRFRQIWNLKQETKKQYLK